MYGAGLWRKAGGFRMYAKAKGTGPLGEMWGCLEGPMFPIRASLEDGAVPWKEDGQGRPSWEPCGSVPYQAILQVGKRRFREGR